MLLCSVVASEAWDSLQKARGCLHCDTGKVAKHVGICSFPVAQFLREVGQKGGNGRVREVLACRAVEISFLVSMIGCARVVRFRKERWCVAPKMEFARTS